MVLWKHDMKPFDYIKKQELVAQELAKQHNLTPQQSRDLMHELSGSWWDYYKNNYDIFPYYMHRDYKKRAKEIMQKYGVMNLCRLLDFAFSLRMYHWFIKGNRYPADDACDYFPSSIPTGLSPEIWIHLFRKRGRGNRALWECHKLWEGLYLIVIADSLNKWYVARQTKS